MTTTMSRAMERSIRNLDAAERNLYTLHKMRSDRRRIKKNTRRLNSARRKLHNLVGTVAGQGVDPLQLPLSPEHHLIVSEVWLQYRRIVEFHLDGETHRFMGLPERSVTRPPPKPRAA